MQEKRSPFFHSTLITGRDSHERKNYALKLVAAALGTPLEKRIGIDFFEVGQEPEPARLSIEEMRELQGQLATKPYQSPKKVALILEAQRLTLAAQNCLLKTLEEPPAHALLILTAEDTESVLPTVRSRCRLIDLGPAPYEGKADKGRNLLELLQKNRGQRLLWVEENKKMLSRREEVLALLDAWLVTLREVIINPKACPTARRDAPPYSLRVERSYQKAIQQILTTKKTVATVNVNLRLALEVLLLHLPQTE